MATIPGATPAVQDTGDAPPRHGMRFPAFVTLIAALMAANALAIDSMLPALPAMGEALGISTPNGEQWIITAYLLGFGGAQLFYGPLSDSLGRRPLLLAGLALYVAASLGAALSSSLEVMLLMRVLQGVGAAATRVLAVAIVRDCYAGRQMARVMSLAMIVFLAVPVLAPSIGQLILILAPWRWIFGVLCVFGVAVLAWAALRLPETLRPEDRAPVSPRRVWDGARQTLTNRASVGYTLALTLTMGGLFGFINSAQQVFAVVFRAEHLFPAVFAAIAGCMAVAALLNARIVGRLGARRVSQWALAGYILFSLLHLGAALAGWETIWSFGVFQALSMFCFGLMGPNFGSLAMESLGHVAGTASSVQGFFSMVFGASLGFAVGQSFAGTTVPVALGFGGYGLLALAVVAVTERGRLWRAEPAPAGARGAAA